MHTESHTAVFIKHSQRNLNEKAVRNNITAITASVNSRSLAASGWTVEASEHPFTSGHYEADTEEKPDHRNVATSRLHFLISYSRGDKPPGKTDLTALARKMATRANVPASGNWRLETLDDKPYVVVEGTDVILSENVDNIGYTDCDLPDDFEEYFSHLYGLENHIGMIRSRLEAAIQSGWTNRFHTVLIGPPGCGKSDICRSLKRALGDDAVIEYDGTAMTSAGAIKDLVERDILPRVMVVEEIEKANEACAAFLLGVMDQRAEIRKTTARQSIQRDAKLYCIATVNNKALFDKFQSGALASRFGKPIGFKRPSREMRALILSREIEKVGGDEKWIEPTLDYCETNGIDDPRMLISICLSGREKLLTGEYQKMMDATAIETTEQVADWSTLSVPEGSE